LNTLPNINNKIGCDLEVYLVERGHDVEMDFYVWNWLMECFCVGVGGLVRMRHNDIRMLHHASVGSHHKSALRKSFRVCSTLVQCFDGLIYD
jgi:hypothetical protein